MDQLLITASPESANSEVIIPEVIDASIAYFRDGAFEIRADAKTVQRVVMEYLRNKRIQERYRFFRPVTRASIGIASLLIIHKYKIPTVIVKTATSFVNFLFGI